MNFGRCGDAFKFQIWFKKNRSTHSRSLPRSIRNLHCLCFVCHSVKCVPGAQCTGINGGNPMCTTWRKPSWRYTKSLEIVDVSMCRCLGTRGSLELGGVGVVLQFSAANACKRKAEKSSKYQNIQQFLPVSSLLSPSYCSLICNMKMHTMHMIQFNICMS